MRIICVNNKGKFKENEIFIWKFFVKIFPKFIINYNSYPILDLTIIQQILYLYTGSLMKKLNNFICIFDRSIWIKNVRYIFDFDFDLFQKKNSIYR